MAGSYGRGMHHSPEPAGAGPRALVQGARRVAALAGLRRPRLLRGPRLERTVAAPILRTRRTVLRPHRMDDAAAWHRIATAPEVRAGLEWPERSTAESREHLRHRTRHTQLRQAGDFLALGVESRGALVGDVSMHLRAVHPAARVVELGWIVDPAHAGRGLATEAARELVRFAFDEIGAVTVTAVVAPGNTASTRVAERLGFDLAGSHEGRLVFARTAVRHLLDGLGDGADVRVSDDAAIAG